LQLEALESRLVPSGSPHILRDIHPGSAASMPAPVQPPSIAQSAFIDVNGVALFFADDGIHGTDLWKSNGTSAGTVLVKDINQGSGSSRAANEFYDAVNVGGTLFFTANNGVSGPELWRSNGTNAGTVLIKDINPGPTGSMPEDLLNVNGTLFFRANNGASGTELWRSNGTAAGTRMIKDINAGSNGSDSSFITNVLINVNGTVFFRASNGTSGQELWRSDGTAAGTVLVKDMRPGSQGSYPFDFVNANGTLFFDADGAVGGAELWRSDGTAAGTVLVKDINPTGASQPMLLTNVNGTVFFEANDGVHGWELWKSNGSAAGTMIVEDINPGSNPSSPTDLVNFNGTLFFQANNGVHGAELWRSDGTAAGTRMVKDINPGSKNSIPGYLTNVNGVLFFNAANAVVGPELWRSNGTAAGTALVSDIWPGVTGSYLFGLSNVQGTLFFAADNGVSGLEPWALAPTASSSTATQVSLPEMSQPGALPAMAVGRTHANDVPMSETVAHPSFTQAAGGFGLSAPEGHSATPPKQAARLSSHRSGPVDAALSDSENEMGGWW
jgi:ELWxxDGT repeat protein